MAEELKEELEITTKISRKLTEEEREKLVQLIETLPRAELSTLIIQLRRLPDMFFVGYRKLLRGAKLTATETILVDEVLKDEKKRALIVKFPFLFKLTSEDLRFLIKIKENPELLKILKPPPIELPLVKPPEKPPPVKPPVELVAEITEKIEKIKPPRGWRALWPFKSSEFIKSYFIFKGDEGTYPYEVWKLLRRTLLSTMADPEVRNFLYTLKGIPVDGVINGKLVEQLKEEPPGKLAAQVAKRPEPEERRLAKIAYHVPSYNTITNYFFALRKLNLIKLKERKKGKFKHAISRHYYVINKDMINSIMWKMPRVYAYPLSFLGKKRWNDLLFYVNSVRTGEESPPAWYLEDIEEFKVQHAFIEYYPELVMHIAKERGISENELKREIIESKYKF